MGLYSTLWFGFKVPTNEIPREDLRRIYPEDVCCDEFSDIYTIVAVLKSSDCAFQGLPYRWIKEHEALIKEEWEKHSQLHKYPTVLMRETTCTENMSVSYDETPYSFEDLFED